MILLYGATGYTGELCAEVAHERGIELVLAGRSDAKVRALSDRFGMKSRVFGLESRSEVERGIEGASVVLHAAGPFSRTSRPMADACLARGVHYLDLTGEVEVFESLAARDDEARRAGVLLLPGVGFDVVPSDCLALHVARRLPDATELVLGFASIGGALSHGTATTVVENLGRPSLVRRSGVLRDIPLGSVARRIDFGAGPQQALAIPWGDLSTAFVSTRIPNITVFTAVPRGARLGARVVGALGPLLGSSPVRALLTRSVDARPPGPSAGARERAFSLLFAEATNARGDVVTSRLRTPEGYTLTARAGVEIARRVASGAAAPGFHTPGTLLGADFVLELEGVRRTDD